MAKTKEPTLESINSKIVGLRLRRQSIAASTLCGFSTNSRNKETYHMFAIDKDGTSGKFKEEVLAMLDRNIMQLDAQYKELHEAIELMKDVKSDFKDGRDNENS